MKVLEVKNNLVKIEYTLADNLLLSGFVIIEDSQSPYVAQVLSLKADNGINYAIVKLLFTFNDEGIVKNYDGTIPSLDAEITKLGSDELLDILPVNTPLEVGIIAHQGISLHVDMSIFEKNLLICSDNTEDSNIILANFIHQLDENACKSIIFDVDGSYSGEKLKFGRDFKLPLNYETINYIYDHDLSDLAPASKAVIQEIFLEVQEYSKTVLDKFIPFDTFMNVVEQQYNLLGIPELILLKNRLLKYREMNVFAQSPKEIQGLRAAIRANQSNTLDISAADDVLQGEIMKYVYDTIDEIDLFVYSFVQLNNENTDKKLIRHFLAKDKVYTTFVSSHNFKYLFELKERASNIILFAPQVMQHDFNAYNTFLNKLNPDEFIIYGKATQNIPLIVELASVFEDSKENVTEEETDVTSQKDEQAIQDVFSDESNSYSYETLIEDTALVADEQNINQEDTTVLDNTDSESAQELVVNEAGTVPPEAEANNVEKASVLSESKKLSDDEFKENASDTQDVSEEETEIETVENDEIQDDYIKAETVEEEEEEPAGEKIPSEDEIEAVEESEEVEEPLKEYDDSEDFQSVVSESDDEIKEEDTSDNEFVTSQSEDLVEIDEVDTETLSDIIDKEIEAEIYTDTNSQEETIDNVLQELKIDIPPVDELISDVSEGEQNIILHELEEFSQDVEENTDVSDNSQISSSAIQEEYEHTPMEELTEDDLNFIQGVNSPSEEDALPVYPVENLTVEGTESQVFAAGDHVSHPKYGEGIVEKMIRYGNKSLCSISFINVGRRLLDPAISEITKM